MIKIKIFFFIFFFLFLISPLISAKNKIKPLDVIKVADGVYVHYGKHENLYEGNMGDIANLGFIIGGESIAVIDTGGSYIVGEALRLAIKKISQISLIKHKFREKSKNLPKSHKINKCWFL